MPVLLAAAVTMYALSGVGSLNSQSGGNHPPCAVGEKVSVSTVAKTSYRYKVENVADISIIKQIVVTPISKRCSITVREFDPNNYNIKLADNYFLKIPVDGGESEIVKSLAFVVGRSSYDPAYALNQKKGHCGDKAVDSVTYSLQTFNCIALVHSGKRDILQFWRERDGKSELVGSMLLGSRFSGFTAGDRAHMLGSEIALIRENGPGMPASIDVMRIVSYSRK